MLDTDSTEVIRVPGMDGKIRQLPFGCSSVPYFYNVAWGLNHLKQFYIQMSSEEEHQIKMGLTDIFFQT